jgi:aminoglycoside 6'-N-acetyltransferase I
MLRRAAAQSNEKMVMSEIEVRLVAADEAELFDRVAEEVFDEAVDPARLAAYLAMPGHHMVVALDQGTIVGQVAAVVHRHPDKPTELYIDEVGVADGYRWRGIARRMLGVMLAYGKAIGCEEAWVGTEPDNLPAKALYEQRRGKGDDEAEEFVMYVFKL